MKVINENSYSSEEIDINDIIKILKKRLKLIISITLLFSLISGVISFYLITPKYKTQASLFVGKEKGNIGETLNEIDTYTAFISTYVEIIKTKPVISDALRKNNIDISAEKVLENLDVTARLDTQIMDVSYIDEDKDRAFKVINAVTKEFLFKAKKMIPTGDLQILEPAERVDYPFTPNKKLNIIIGTLLGLMVSIGLAFLLEFLNNTYINEDDIQRDLNISVLGEIPIISHKMYKQSKIDSKIKNVKENERLEKC